MTVAAAKKSHSLETQLRKLYPELTIRCSLDITSIVIDVDSLVGEFTEHADTSARIADIIATNRSHFDDLRHYTNRAKSQLAN